ncbi:hypothetical protein BJP48_30110 [Paenibacillus odorifer]|nr:hypothetical protein BJP48_30110 [Paenibacillus odorifer]
MATFFEQNKEFRDSQLPEWEKLINYLFGSPTPENEVITDIKEIKKTLKKIAKSDASNHTFMPDSGGMDLTGCTKSEESGCLELDFDGITHIVKPKKLIFQSFPDVPLEWSYFNLIVDKLPPSGVYENDDDYYEELTELYPNEYISRGYYDAGEYNGKPLPEDARVVLRYFKGSFVIFSKASIYNLADPLKGYNGTHEKYGEEMFENAIERISKALKEKGIK